MVAVLWTAKDVNCNFSSPELDNPYIIGKLSVSEAQIYSFSSIGQKIKKLQLFQFFLPENLEKFRSTKLYGAPLEESTIFLYCSSLGRKSLESSRLGEQKYPISTRQHLRSKKKKQLSQRENSTRNCDCANCVNSHRGVNRQCEMRRESLRCEQV